MIKKLVFLLSLFIVISVLFWISMDTNDLDGVSSQNLLAEQLGHNEKMHDVQTMDRSFRASDDLTDHQADMIDESDVVTLDNQQEPFEQTQNNTREEVNQFITNALLQGYFNRAEAEQFFSRRDFDELAASLPYQSYEDTEIKQDMERILGDALLDNQSQSFLTTLECGSAVCMAALVYEHDEEIRNLIHETVVADSRIYSVISQPVMQDGVKHMRIIFTYSEKINTIEL